MQPVLTDGDIRLRPLALPADIALALPWYGDPEALWFSEGAPDLRCDGDWVAGMYRYLLDRGEVYIIEAATPDGSLLAIGDCALCPETLPIVIGLPAYRSRGVGARVRRLLVGRAIVLGWGRLRIKGVYTHNPRARRMFERAGFRCNGVRRVRGEPDMWTFKDLCLEAAAGPGAGAP